LAISTYLSTNVVRDELFNTHICGFFECSLSLNYKLQYIQNRGYDFCQKMMIITFSPVLSMLLESNLNGIRLIIIAMFLKMILATTVLFVTLD